MLNRSGASMQPLEVKDFSGGITDNFIGANPNKYSDADNLLIVKVGEYSRLVTRPGLRTLDINNARVPTNVKINKYFDSEGQLFQVSDKRVYYNNSGFTHVMGPSGNNALDSGSTTSNYSVAKWNDQVFITNDSYPLPVKVFKNTTWRCHNIGLPEMTGSPTFSAIGADTRLYAFHYYYQYTNNGATYEEEGPVYFYSTPCRGAAPNTITFPSSFTLTNAGGANYDLANVKIKVFRTVNDGSSYFYVGETAHNAGTFLDSIADGDLQLRSPLPYLLDSPQNFAPPRCKYIHQVNGNLIAANIKVDGVVYPSRFRINAKPFIWSMPEEFEGDCEEEIKGVSSYNTQPIIFCEKKVYRIEGEYFIDGSGNITKRVIHNTAGCINNNSIVQTDIGLFWCGNDGWYFTDGYQVVRISRHLSTTYRDLSISASQKSFIHGAYEARRRLVVWSMLDTDTNLDSDICYVLDLNYGVSEEMPFTTFSGGTNFRTTCNYYFDSKLIQSHYSGYTLYYEDTAFDDVKINVAVSPPLWTTVTIIYDHITAAFDFGTSSYRKWVTSINVRAENASSVSLKISANNDNSQEYKELTSVFFQGQMAWGDSVVEWGDVDARWNYFPIIAFTRKMPAGGLRCTYKQIRFTNDYSEIDTSTRAGTAVFNGTTNTAVLGINWANSVTDYFISTALDNYETQYKILSQSGVNLTIEDINNTLPTGTYDWKIKGYRKEEILKIISYTVNFAVIGQSFEPYKVTT